MVVSDTTAITSLLKIGEVDLLRRLFQEVVIPPAVHEELLSYHPVLPPWLVVQTVAISDALRLWLRPLDSGEAQAIALAQLQRAELLIIDEKRGRALAEQGGVRCIGLAGVLLLAKQRQHIGSVEAMLSRLEQQANFYLAAPVKQKLLAAASERFEA
ncbi:MAG: DUF3368 domain-containing protein [Candidatus Competibacteraceae bacterium]